MKVSHSLSLSLPTIANQPPQFISTLSLLAITAAALPLTSDHAEDLGATALGGALGFVAGGPVGAVVGAGVGLGSAEFGEHHRKHEQRERERAAAAAQPVITVHQIAKREHHHGLHDFESALAGGTVGFVVGGKDS